MKQRTRADRRKVDKIERVLLQMARRGDDWAGKATCFAGPSEFHFDSLAGLFEWLKKRARSG